MFLMTFRRFPTTFRRCSKIVPKAWRTSPNIFGTFSEDCRRLPKVAEYFPGGTDDVSIIQHHLWVLFKRLCSYSDGNLKTYDNNLLSSRVKISCYLHMWRYHVYARKLTWYFTGVYIINPDSFICFCWFNTVKIDPYTATRSLSRSFRNVKSSFWVGAPSIWSYICT